MEISSSQGSLSTNNSTQNIQNSPQQSFNILDQILSQIDPDIADAFKEATIGDDPKKRELRAMVFTAEFRFPMFMMFQDGNYPSKMPNDVKSAMQEQVKEFKALGSQKEKNIYKLDWLLNSIGFEQSSDPGMEQVLQSIRETYSGEKHNDYKSRDEINDDDYALKAFKNDLTTKGAARFLYEFNQEKIEAMVDKYREELEKMKEENPDMDINIDEMVSNYRKELLERLAELEKSRKKSPINISSLQNKKENNLEELLKNVV